LISRRVVDRDSIADFSKSFAQQKNRSRLRVADVMFLDAFWEQPFAAALTPACESCATTFGPHPGTKAVLTFACPLGWLVSAFHNTEQELRHVLGAVTVEATLALSTLLADPRYHRRSRKLSDEQYTRRKNLCLAKIRCCNPWRDTRALVLVGRSFTVAF